MMDDVAPKPEGMSEEFYENCTDVDAKRARTIIQHILRHGHITTEEVFELYGYDHPPRAIRDVRESGIPLETDRTASTKTGRRIGAYRFDDKKEITRGRIGGRRAFSKKFKQQLVAHYGSRSMLTNETLEPRYLQIDHRILYEVAGNAAAENVASYMLLDAPAQRAKSWSCEHCENLLIKKDPGTCSECFWAFPEHYTHVAMRPERRLDVVWSGESTINYDLLVERAKREERTPQESVKEAVEDYLNTGKKV